MIVSIPKCQSLGTAAQTGARGKGAADCSRKDGPSRADSRHEKTGVGGRGVAEEGEHGLPLLQSGHSRADCARRKLGWRRGWGRVMSTGGGRSMDHLRAVWILQCQVCVLCVLFPCSLCSERKIIAFIRSVFLKLFDIKKIHSFY